MTVSVRESFKTFFSPVMNKTLVFSYLAIYSVMVIPYLLYSDTKNPEYMIPGYILYFLAMLFLPGVQIMTINNLVNNKENALPHFSQTGKIFVQGLKMVVWSTVIAMVMFAFGLVFCLLFMFLIKQSSDMPLMPICGFIIFILLLILFALKYTIPAYCYYAKTLEFSSFFNFAKISAFMKNRDCCYGSYLIKIIGTVILYSVIVLALFVALFLCVFFANGMQGNFEQDKLLIPLYFFYIIAWGIFGFAFYIPLTAQFIKSADDDDSII